MKNIELTNNTIDIEDSYISKFPSEFRMLIDFINEAKTLGDLNLANKLFHFMLKNDIKTWGENNLQFEIESNGCDYYYDLLVVYLEGENYELYENNVCIPLPLLKKKEMRYVIHRGAEIVEKKDHNRDIEENQKKLNDLIKKINEKFPEIKII